jgi:hypothetical protein
MATDKSEPRTGLILRLGALAVVTLLIVHAALSAYYDHMAKAEVIRKLGTPEALINLRTDEKARLSAGGTPIDRAMQTLVEKGRIGAGPAIAPTVSKDVAPLQGWTKMPGDVPPAMIAPPVPTATELPADAGAALDGASAMNAKPDAGAKGAGGAHPTHK